jgi:hypothetical protein
MMLVGALFALLIASLLAAVVCAWLLTGRPARWSPPGGRRGLSAEAALRRHPASRARRLEFPELFGPDPDVPGTDPPQPPARAVGPDDDPQFLSALDRLIHGDNHDGP